MATSMVERMIGAAMLNVDTYEEVEADQDATGQAAIVVAVVAACAAIGASPLGIFTAAFAAVGALFQWLIWAGITYFVGANVFKADVTWGEMLRALGFAQAPGVLYITGIIPLLSLPIIFVTWLWMLATAFVGSRQALDLSNGKTFITILIGGLVAVALRSLPVLGPIFGG